MGLPTTKNKPSINIKNFASNLNNNKNSITIYHNKLYSLLSLSIKRGSVA